MEQPTKERRNNQRRNKEQNAQSTKGTTNEGTTNEGTTKTKRPKKYKGIFKNAPPPPQKKIVFVAGTVSQNRYNTQTLYITKNDYLCVYNF